MKSTFDKNAEKFVNLMVEKIESLSMNWQKPWFSKVNSKQNFLPQNLTGRTYSGGNAFLLYFLCEKYNYQTPVFLTFNQARNEGINVLKGAAAFPVYYTLFCAYHRQTNEKISYDEYKKLSEEEQKEYRLAAYTKYFQVFNLDQTNFAEKYPNRWDILKAKFSGEEQPQEEKEMYVNPILDEMNKNQNWVCPIQTVSSDSAFYSISNDSITLPLKSQFKDGESLYDVAAVLTTRQGDQIVLSKSNATDAELRQNEDDNVFIKKAQIISAEISRYFSSDIQISYNTRKRINPQMRSPLCMVLENFNEKGFCKYYHEATNMEYLYDPTTKLCFSFFADERDESLLEVYGLSSWASNLVEKQISIATLANLYTIIGL